MCDSYCPSAACVTGNGWRQRLKPASHGQMLNSDIMVGLQSVVWPWQKVGHSLKTMGHDIYYERGKAEEWWYCNCAVSCHWRLPESRQRAHTHTLAMYSWQAPYFSHFKGVVSTLSCNLKGHFHPLPKILKGHPLKQMKGKGHNDVTNKTPNKSIQLTSYFCTQHQQHVKWCLGQRSTFSVSNFMNSLQTNPNVGMVSFWRHWCSFSKIVAWFNYCERGVARCYRRREVTSQ